MQATDDIALEYARLRVRLGLVPASEKPSIDARYRVEQTLGRGAMGIVYLVVDERLRRRVALKLVRPALGIAPERLHARLEREAQALATVDHPNVVHLHDVGNHHGATYFTMQYVPGTTLRRWQDREGRTTRERLDAYLQAARGLAAAHERGIVHRDFKPDNVLVGDDGIVRVADFGIAAALALDEQHDTLDSLAAASQAAANDQPETITLERLTGTGTVLGTPPYMAPEQLAGSRATAHSDQFGFCIALWEAIAGQRPFRGQTPSQLLDATRVLPRAGARELPAWLRPILLRGVAVDPRDRFADMNQLVAAIEHARGRGRRIGGSAVLGLGLVAAAALGWWLSPDEPIEHERCEAFSEQIDEVWTPARRTELAKLAALDPAASEHALTTLDQMAADWRASAEATCEHELAPAPDSRQRLCHEAWLVALDRSIELIAARSSTSTLTHLPDLLARLVPPQANYCAFEPDPRLDPEVARTASAAREAAEFGDHEQARQLADRAIARALMLDAGPYSVDRAEAFEARGEVLVLAGEIEPALVSLADAQAQAIASGHRGAQLASALWRAQASVTPGRTAETDLAASYLESAEPIVYVLELDQADPRRGDLESTRALIEQARGNLELALEHHRRALAIYTDAAQPIRVARSLINLGTIHHQLDDIDQARAAYQQAARVLADAGVPERHRFSLTLDYHLGLIGYQTSDAAGLNALDRVARLHGDPLTQLRALNYGLALALDVGSAELAFDWAIRALAELDRQPDPPGDLAVEIESSAAFVLASAGDPAGEVRLDAAEARAAALDLETHVNVRCTRIDWLEEQGRCDEARRRLAQLDAFVEPLDPEFRARVVAPWRAGKPSLACPTD